MCRRKSLANENFGQNHVYTAVLLSTHMAQQVRLERPNNGMSDVSQVSVVASKKPYIHFNSRESIYMMLPRLTCQHRIPGAFTLSIECRVYFKVWRLWFNGNGWQHVPIIEYICHLVSTLLSSIYTKITSSAVATFSIRLRP